MSKRLDNYKWRLVFGAEGSVTIEPHDTIGLDIATVHRLMVTHYVNKVSSLVRMTDEEFLKDQGYFEDGSE